MKKKKNNKKNNKEDGAIFSTLHLRPLKNNKFEVLSWYTYKDITIAPHYKTNGADVPRIFWFIFPPFAPKHLEAVVLHDYLVEHAYINSIKKDEFMYHIRYANMIFKEKLLSDHNTLVNKIAVWLLKQYWEIRFKFNIKLPKSIF